MKQRILQWILNVFGTVYVLIERWVEYPDDDVILGMPIDEDIQRMSRKNLCRYMDAVLPQKGFFDIQSTSKIRLGFSFGIRSRAISPLRATEILHPMLARVFRRTLIFSLVSSTIITVIESAGNNFPLPSMQSLSKILFNPS